MDNLKRVIVTIFGQQIPLTSDGNEETVRAIARMVDEEMETVAGQVHNQDVGRIAIAASLNIAAELFQLRQQLQKLEGDLADRADEITASIEHLLKTEQL